MPSDPVSARAATGSDQFSLMNRGYTVEQYETFIQRAIHTFPMYPLPVTSSWFPLGA